MTSKAKHCLVCKAKMQNKDAYCWRCGHKCVEKQHLWLMGFSYTVVHDYWIKNHLIEVDAVKTCPECGYELDHKHQWFCPGCGKALTWSCVHGGRGNFACCHRTD